MDYEFRSIRSNAMERRESRGGHYRNDFPWKTAQAVHSRMAPETA